MTLSSLPFNWFDVVVLAVIGFGIHRGRKNGMSEELLSLLKWLALVVGCAFIYEPLGAEIARATSVFSLLSSYLMAYFTVALLIAVAFALFKKWLGGKLLGSDVFGRSEFYLGMGAGMVKFACILLVGLALLNARATTADEISADVQYQQDLYGSTYFPTLYSLQSQVFEKSFTGALIRDHLAVLLIKPTIPEKKELKRQELAF